MQVGGAQTLDQNTRQVQKGGPPWMCGQHNVMATVGHNTGQNVHEGHTLNPKIEIINIWPRREFNPGHRVWRKVLYQPRHGDELWYLFTRTFLFFSCKQ